MRAMRSFETGLRRVVVTALVLLAAPLLLAGCSSDPEPLGVPTNFAATYDQGVVHTTWESGGGEEMFMVMRVDTADSTTMTWNVPATDTSYDDDTAVSGATYRYMVHAMRGEDVSDPSNMVTLTIP